MTDEELLKGLRRMPDWGHWATTAADRIEELKAALVAAEQEKRHD